jgi:DNA-binding NarL/FixJ family response regulator
MNESRATGSCRICDGCPSVLVAISHPDMRRLTLDVLTREHGCWSAAPLQGELRDALERLAPDLAVVDAAAFPACCNESSRSYPSCRVIVVGPEPDPAYREAALRLGAGGWVARDHIADDLTSTMRVALGCPHGPCPTPV